MDVRQSATDLSSGAESQADPSLVVDGPTVRFTDGQYARFSRVRMLPGGGLAAELTRNVLTECPESTPAYVTDTVIYGPGIWQSVYTAPRGVLTAWTWRRDDNGEIRQDRHVVATNVTEGEIRPHTVAWLRKYAIAESQLGEIAELALSQRVTVSDPESIALKFYFMLPPRDAAPRTIR